MNLYNKYRPQSFDEVLGNEEAIESIRKSFARKTHSHVYLLSGSPGTGKTTIARIMAKELGAEGLDIREINSSSNRGIDTARDISQQIRYTPSFGKSMVYIIDEVHKTTNDFMNAMLKPCEDTPDYVYFIFCTTDPQKIIKALKQRCTEIKTKPLDSNVIYKLVKRVAKQEGIDFKDTSVPYAIAENSEGSARKALVILENISTIENNEKRLKFIKENSVNDEDPEIIQLCRVLINENSKWGEVSKVLKTLKETGKLDDSETVRYIVMGYMTSVLLNGKLHKRAAIALDAFSENTYNTGKYGIVLACLNVIS